MHAHCVYSTRDCTALHCTALHCTLTTTSCALESTRDMSFVICPHDLSYTHHPCTLLHGTRTALTQQLSVLLCCCKALAIAPAQSSTLAMVQHLLLHFLRTHYVHCCEALVISPMHINNACCLKVPVTKPRTVC
jgi:hypothetical protein